MSVKIKGGDFVFEKRFSAGPGESISYQPVSPVTGKPYYLVSLKKLDKDIAETHSALCQMEHDLRDAEDAFRLMLKFDQSEDAEVRYAIFSHAVVSYYRVFNSKYGRETVGVDQKKFVGEEKSSKQLHDFLRTVRNKIVAHSDTNEFSFPESYIFFDNERMEHIMGVGPMNFCLQGLGNEDVIRIADYIKEVADRTKVRINGLNKMVTDMIVLNGTKNLE